MISVSLDCEMFAPCFMSQCLRLPLQLSWLRICLQCRRLGFDPWVGKIPLEKGKATHSSILACIIPWTV